ncbi:MAG: Wzz/FepE/Etk N-terminal domain-containing protein [bacterium]|nr:Wzz/FepE/Etk N-terminal domain-containing protein [bacterium]
MERWEDRRDTIALPWLWRALRSQWQWIAAGVALGAMLAVAIIVLSERRYEAQAKLLVESPTGTALAGAGGLASLIGAGSPDLNTQVEILLARPVLEKVQQQAGINAPYRDFEKRFRATAVRNTNLIEVTASDSTPEGAQRLAQTWVETYLSYVRALYEQSPSTLVEKLSKELESQEAQLRRASDRITAFLKARGVVAPEAELGKRVEKFADLLESQRQQEARQVALERQIAALRAQLQREPKFYEAMRNLAVPPEVQQLNTKIAELEIQRSGLLQEFQPDAPEVKIVEQQIAQAQRERENLLAQAVDKQFLTLAKQESVNPLYLDLTRALLTAESELQASRATLAILQRQQAEFERLFRRTPDLMAEYADLKRQYEAALTIWTEKVRAYEQARAQQLIGKVSPVLMQPPAVPDRPVFPRPVLTMGLGTVLGLMLGMLGALMAAWRKRQLSDRWEVERLLNAPVLAETRGALNPAAAQLIAWQLRALGGGESWHRALALPLTHQVRPIAQQVAEMLQVSEAEADTTNLPAPAYTNGALHIYTAAPDAPAIHPAERLILVAPKGYVLDEPTLHMLAQTGDRLVGVILVEEPR